MDVDKRQENYCAWLITRSVFRSRAARHRIERKYKTRRTTVSAAVLEMDGKEVVGLGLMPGTTSERPNELYDQQWRQFETSNTSGV